MILKTLDYRKSQTEAVEIEEWNYFDNIQSAATTYDEVNKMAVVRCSFKDGNTITIAVPNVAYLMSDSGKTIDKIYATKDGDEWETEDPIYPTLQDAIDAAMNNKSV